MPVDKQAAFSVPTAPAAIAAALIRAALKGALATLQEGHPYASLVLVATEPGGAPLLLISRLAQHTANLEKDARCSLLFDGTDGEADPLSAARVTVRGTLRRTDDPVALKRFLARHPSAQGYAAFPDFSTYRMEIASAHFIGGFGRIVDLPAGDLLLPQEQAHALLDAEADIVAHMNADHADAIGLYAAKLAGQPPGDWRMTGIDPAGFDLVARSRGVRIGFPHPVLSPGDARRALVALASEARAAH